MSDEETLRQLSPLPNNVPDLIRLLLALYPQRCKKPNESLEEHLYYSGAAALAELLSIAHSMEEQEKIGEMTEGEQKFFERFKTASVMV